jgi:Bacterial EndoU nuclease
MLLGLEKPMAVDGLPHGEPDGNTHLDKRAGRNMDIPATARREPAESRNRSEYYDALRTASGEPDQRAEGTGWDAIDAADRPPLDNVVLPPERALHILEGDARGGGHRHGTGRPGKTEFPAGWDDDKILGAIRDVARAPDQPPVYQNWNSRWLVRGTRDDVEIVAIMAKDGRIWTGWPRPGAPGVRKNPEEA